MTSSASGKRRGRGDDAIYFDQSKSSYVGAVSLGYTAAGNRRRRKVYGRTKAEVRDKLKELRTEIETGVTSSARYTVAEMVRKWHEVGLKDRAPKRLRNAGLLSTITSCRRLVRPSCGT